MTGYSTLRAVIEREMAKHRESLDDVLLSTLTDVQLIKPLIVGIGAPWFPAFTLWTANRVYFPTHYDNGPAVGSVSRTPDGSKTPSGGSL